MLRGVGASSDTKIEPVLKTKKHVNLNTRFTKDNSCNSNSEEVAAIHITKLSEVESGLDAALDKINDLKSSKQWRNIHFVKLPDGSTGSSPLTFFKFFLYSIQFSG